MSSRKLLIAYVFLVGIPLLALIGIVRGGQRLVAPVSVGGNWDVAADFSPLSGKPCGELLAAARQPAFTISQSGNQFVLTVNSPRSVSLTGTVHGMVLSAGADDPPASGNGSCSSGQAVAITATVTKDGERRSLTGSLRLKSCPSCSPVAFHAVRQAVEKAGGQ